MGIGLLGPLEIDGNPLSLSPRDGVVLTALAVRRGQVIAADQLADALWGDEPPVSWPKVVQGCVVRLRRILGSSTIETIGGGYRLAVAADDLDTHHFEDLVERGRAWAISGEPERAASAFARALALWRGAPFADLDRWLPGRIEAIRLEELRRGVEEELLDCRLRTGEHHEVVGEAEARVSEQPLRERRWAILALAQYRCGRQADALRSLHSARLTLANQLGIDPGDELVALEAAILRQDTALIASHEASAVAEQCPYKGLAPYDVSDAEIFFGRRTEVAMCLDRVQTTRLLVVAGPSGSGKSSLVRAGLIPALERQGRGTAVFVPGSDPIAAMSSAVASSEVTPVLVVDQFEELFTLGDGPETARVLCAQLADYAAEKAPVVVAIRADYVAALAIEPAFTRLAEQGLHLVSQLAGDALREAIEGPAALAGLRLEHGLVDLLMRDAEGEPGALPLLSHALAETWLRRDGRVLTVEGYRATGGIRGAVGRSAERLYESLPPELRIVLQSVMLRLVMPSADGGAVGTRVSIRTLTGDPARERVVRLLVRARLVTAQQETVELAHEALARAWPRLQAWLDDDRAGQRILRHLSAAADGWEALGRPASELYRGTRLDTALEWRDAARPDLTAPERAFLDASEAEAASLHRALAERARHQTRQNKRLRVLLTAAAAFLVLCIVAGVAAVSQRNSAQRSATNARAAEIVAQAHRLSTLALTVNDIDQALLLATQGRRLDDSTDTRTNLLAAMNRRPQAIAVIRHPALSTFGRLVVTGDGHYLATGDLGGLVFFDTATNRPVAQPVTESTPWPAMTPTPDGHGVAVVIADAVRFFDAATGAETRPRIQLADDVGRPRHSPVVPGLTRARSLAMSGNGRYLAAGVNADNDGPGTGFELIWDLAAPESPPRRVSSGLDKPSVAFTPDNHLIVVGEDDPQPRLAVVDPITGAVAATIPGARAPIAVSPDGTTLAARQGDALALFNWVTGERRQVLAVDNRTLAVAFSSDGRRLASAEEDRSIEVWDTVSGERTDVLAGHSGPAAAVGFGADAKTLYSISADGAVIVWDLVGDRRLISQIAPPDRTPVSLALVVPSPDGRTLSYLYQDQIGVDHFATRALAGGPVGIQHSSQHPLAIWFDWTPDGQHLVTVGDDAMARLWDPSTGGLVAERNLLPFGSDSGSIGWRPGGDTIFVGLHAGGVVELDAHTLNVVGQPFSFDRYVSNVDVSPDGRILAVALREPNAVVLVNRVTRQLLATLDGIDADWRLEFSPNGSVLAAGGSNGLVTLIDPIARRTVGSLHGVDGPVVSLAFSPESAGLVTSSTDGTVELWDIARRERVARITPGEPGRRVFAWFDSNGRTIVAADERGGIWKFSSQPDDWQRRACEIAGRNFTRQEWNQLQPGRAYERTCPALPPGP